MSFGYFSLPRSLTRDPLWINLPPAYKEVFLVILDLCIFKPTKFDDHGVIIDLLPGQICISERQLLKHCSKYISRIEIQRSIKKLILYDFVGQKVSHRKSVITITHKDTYELILRSSEPTSEPNLSQTCAKLEPESNNEKNVKNEKKETPLATKLLAEFFDSLLSKIPNFDPQKIRSMKKAKNQLTAMQKMIELYGEEKIKMLFKYAHESTFWIAHVHSPLYLKSKAETLSKQMENTKKPSESNYEYAKMIYQEYKSASYELQINANEITFIQLVGHQQPLSLKFSDSGFKDQLENNLKKKGFAKQNNDQKNEGLYKAI